MHSVRLLKSMMEILSTWIAPPNIIQMFDSSESILQIKTKKQGRNRATMMRQKVSSRIERIDSIRLSSMEVISVRIRINDAEIWYDLSMSRRILISGNV